MMFRSCSGRCAKGSTTSDLTVTDFGPVEGTIGTLPSLPFNEGFLDDAEVLVRGDDVEVDDVEGGSFSSSGGMFWESTTASIVGFGGVGRTQVLACFV